MKKFLTLMFMLFFAASPLLAAQQIVSFPPDYKVRSRATKYNANFTELYTMGHDSYSALQEYSDGDIATSDHNVYISLQDNNTGHAVTDAVWWQQGTGGSSLPTGALNQLLQHNGTEWAATSTIDGLSSISVPSIESYQVGHTSLVDDNATDAAHLLTAQKIHSLVGAGGIAHAPSDTHYYSSHGGAWARIPYTDVLGIPDLTTKQDADADLTTASGADTAGNSTYFGKNASGVVGFFALPSGSGTDDQVASEVPFTPNGSISSTDVQAAIQEVRDEAGSGSPASETVAGIAEIATNAEIDTGSDNTRIVSPAGLTHAFENKAFSLNGDYGNLLWNTSDNLINDTSGDNHHLWSASKITAAVNGRQVADPDLTAAASADAAGNNSYFGKDASGTVGFHVIAGGGSGNVNLSEGATAPTAGSLPEGSLYHYTTDHTLYLQTATGLLHSAAWTWTANAAVTRTLSITDPGNGDVITCNDADLSAAINCGNGNAKCSATASNNAVISGITGTAAASRHWVAWTGDITGNATNNGTVTMDANKSGSATFAADSGGNEVFAWTGDTSNDADTPAGSTATVVGAFTRTAAAAHTGANGGDTVNSTAANGLSFPLPGGYDYNRGTWHGWINPNDVTTAYKYIVILGRGSGGYAVLTLDMEGGDVTATVSSNAGDRTAYVTAGVVGTWMEVTVRWLMNDPAGYVTIDVDGTSSTTTITSETFASAPTRLAIGSDGYHSSWDAYIDDVKLYQSDTEVLP